MASRSGGNRVCPKCGTRLGQKSLCPICDKAEQQNEKAGGNDPVSAPSDYVSRVIDFVDPEQRDGDQGRRFFRMYRFDLGRDPGRRDDDRGTRLRRLFPPDFSRDPEPCDNNREFRVLRLCPAEICHDP